MPDHPRLSAIEVELLRQSAVLVMYDELEDGQLVMLAHREDSTEYLYRVRFMVRDVDQFIAFRPEVRLQPWPAAVALMAEQMSEERS